MGMVQLFAVAYLFTLVFLFFRQFLCSRSVHSSRYVLIQSISITFTGTEHWLLQFAFRCVYCVLLRSWFWLLFAWFTTCVKHLLALCFSLSPSYCASSELLWRCSLRVSSFLWYLPFLFLQWGLMSLTHVWFAMNGSIYVFHNPCHYLSNCRSKCSLWCSVSFTLFMCF